MIGAQLESAAIESSLMNSHQLEYVSYPGDRAYLSCVNWLKPAFPDLKMMEFKGYIAQDVLIERCVT